MKAKDNPFRAERVQSVRFRFDSVENGFTLPDLLARLEAMQWRGAIVGPQGSGKTTLLEELEPHFAARNWQICRLRLSREEPRFAPGLLDELSARLTSQHMILLDGAEQLNGFTWRRFERLSRRAAGLIITSHRTGLLPTLVQCHTSPQLLRDILDELLGDDAARWHDEVNELWTRHQGNLRSALRQLYDIHAEPTDFNLINSQW